MVFIAFTAKLAAMYAITEPASALLQHVNGDRSLTQLTKLKPKNTITAVLTAIDRACSGILASHVCLLASGLLPDGGLSYDWQVSPELFWTFPAS
jgi:hypothetical protein